MRCGGRSFQKPKKKESIDNERETDRKRDRERKKK